MISNNIYYKRIIKQIKYIFSKYTTCQLKANKIKLLKIEKFKMIIFNRPKEHIGDISVISIELINNENNIFLKKVGNINTCLLF